MKGWIDAFELAGLVEDTSGETGEDYSVCTLTVAAVPAGHTYVRHLMSPRSTHRFPEPAFRVLTDPPSTLSDPPTGAPWWPPTALDPNWVHEADIDIFHLHFGFDAYSPEELSSVVDALDAKNIPLIYTVHDLVNPHHLDTSLHDSHLDVLIPRATEVITLSDYAACEIQRRWGIRAHVVPHPHVVDLEIMQQRGISPRRNNNEFRMGVHLKSMRANMIAIPLLEAALSALARVDHGVLQVNVHHDVFDAGGARHHPELRSWLCEAADNERIDLVVHDYYTEEQLFDYLSSLHASILPYSFGTHSGWLEACHDLGTYVVAPDIGGYADQGADALFRWSRESTAAVPPSVLPRPEHETDVTVSGLEAAVLAVAALSRNESAKDRSDAVQLRLNHRSLQREAIHSAHLKIYRRAVMARGHRLSASER